MSEEKKSCASCIFCTHKDYGYSNYTVLGTNVECLFGLMSSDDEDEAKLAAAVATAETCPHFTPGTGMYLDCDGEDDEAQRKAWIEQYVKTPHSAGTESA